MASEVDDNDLLAQVLGVLALLVKYGYYDDPEDVDDVLRPLTSVLNGFDDIPFPSVEVPPEGEPLSHELASLSPRPASQLFSMSPRRVKKLGRLGTKLMSVAKKPVI